MTSILFLLAFTTALGWAVTAFFGDGITRPERAAWAFVCGLMVHAALYAIGIALGLEPGPRKLLAAEALTLVAALVLGRRRRAQPGSAPARENSGSLFVVALLAAVAGVAFFTASALAEPMWATDFLAIWGLKGKTIFFASGVPERLFRDPELAWSHPEYPLLLPLILASLSAAVRDWNDHALALLYPLFQIGTALAAYGFLARRAGRAAGAIAAALIGLFLPLYRAGHVGMADIPLALGFVLVSTALLDALEDSSAAVRVRLALSALFCGGLKQEGLLYVVLLSVTMLVAARPERRRDLAGHLAALLLPVSAYWAVVRLWRGKLDHADFDLSLLHPDRWPELAGRAGDVANRLLTVDLAGAAAVPVIAIALLLALTRRGRADLLLVPLFTQLVIYAGVSVLSIYGAVWHAQTSFARTVAALFPAAAIVLGARSGQLFSRPAHGSREPTSRASRTRFRLREKAPGSLRDERAEPRAGE